MAKRNSQLTELLIVAQDDYLTIVDTSAGQSKRVSVKNLTGAPDVGWTATGESWSFSSYSSTTQIGVVTVPTDATTKYSIGMWIRISQATGGTKYGRILSLTATTLSIWFASYTLNNEAISSPVYSPLAHPFGLPITIAEGQPYRFNAYKSSNQAITINTLTKITFTNEAYDPLNLYNGTDTFTAPVTGLYFINAIIQTLNGTATTDLNAGLYKNGALLRKGGNLKNGVYPQVQVIGQFPLTAGDTVDLRFINIAAADSIEGNQSSGNFEASLLSRT